MTVAWREPRTQTSGSYFSLNLSHNPGNRFAFLARRREKLAHADVERGTDCFYGAAREAL
jgi:hypothetical protein